MKTLVLVWSTLICSLGVAAAQQAATATLSGRVVDPNGAVIVGAQITAKNKGTGIQRETKTNDQGLFVLTNLAPGEYEVKVEAPRFKTGSQLGTLEVGQEAQASCFFPNDYYNPLISINHHFSSIG